MVASTIRPKDEPAATSVAAGDIFLIDGTTGVRGLDASLPVLRDASGNVAIDNVVAGYTTTATAAGTTTLTATSMWAQYFTGVTTQIVVLPVVSTLAFNHSFYIRNASTGAITVNSSGGNLVATIAAGASVLVSCILLTGTTAASWSANYHGALVATGKVLTVSNSLTLAGTDGTVMTFPTTSATLARTDAANTFTGTQTVGALVATTVNGNTLTAGTGVLTIAAAKTLTVSNSLTLAGTDGTVMTFPGTSDTVVTLAATQTLTNKTLTAPAIGAATGTSLTLTGGGISFATSGQGHVGTTTNDSANAGVVGEIIKSVIASGSAIGLTTGTAANVTSITLTAGDWDLYGSVAFIPAASTTFTFMSGSASTTTAAAGNFLDDQPGWQFGQASAANGGVLIAQNFIGHVKLSGSTTFFLVARSAFAVSTMSAYGYIEGKRTR